MDAASHHLSKISPRLRMLSSAICTQYLCHRALYRTLPLPLPCARDHATATATPYHARAQATYTVHVHATHKDRAAPLTPTQGNAHASSSDAHPQSHTACTALNMHLTLAILPRSRSFKHPLWATTAKNRHIEAYGHVSIRAHVRCMLHALPPTRFMEPRGHRIRPDGGLQHDEEPW